MSAATVSALALPPGFTVAPEAEQRLVSIGRDHTVAAVAHSVDTTFRTRAFRRSAAGMRVRFEPLAVTPTPETFAKVAAAETRRSANAAHELYAMHQGQAREAAALIADEIVHRLGNLASARRHGIGPRELRITDDIQMDLGALRELMMSYPFDRLDSEALAHFLGLLGVCRIEWTCGLPMALNQRKSAMHYWRHKGLLKNSATICEQSRIPAAGTAHVPSTASAATATVAWFTPSC